MNRKFFLETERIGFSKWEHNDLHLAEQLWSDSRVTRFICASGFFSENEIFSRLNTEIENDIKYNIQYWPIFELDDNSFIGCCGLRPRSEDTCEIGFHLLPEFWGKGIAFEAASKVIEYAFNQLGTSRLFAGHNPCNTNSGKVLLKLGFKYIGDEFYPPTGLMHPSYEMSKPK